MSRHVLFLCPAGVSSAVAARAGYPPGVVPAGRTPQGREPVGIVVLGSAWEEVDLLALADDDEQASQAWRPPAEINPSVFRCTAVGTSSAHEASCPP